MKLIYYFIFIVFFSMGICRSDAQEVIAFGPQETKIIGSIPYAVMGQYKAQFGAFKGMITWDEKLQRIQSVYLEIETNSLKSDCSWCDKIARSRRLLNIARYPKIIFKSDKIIWDEGGFKVKGVLEMHGIKRGMIFPFNAEIIIHQRSKRKWVDLKGSWRINRKAFNIVWNRHLDRGGVVVGDYFTVDWEIKTGIR